MAQEENGVNGPLDYMRRMIPGDWPSDNDPHGHAYGIVGAAAAQRQAKRLAANVEDDKMGGYKFKFIGHVPEDLICAACNRVARDAVEGECTHIFCATCTDNLLVCPKCGENTGSEFEPGKVFRKKINNLIVACPRNCPIECKLSEVDQHLSKCTGIPRSVFENDVKIAMRAYLDDMAELRATNNELVEANRIQCCLVAEMRATVAEQVKIIEDLRAKLNELSAQTDRVQQHLDDKATRAEVTAAIREEREIVIMPLFRQSALLQEEENKRFTDELSSVTSTVEWLQSSLIKRIEWTVPRWSEAKATQLSPEIVLDGGYKFRGHVQKGTKEKEDNIGMYLRYEAGPTPILVDFSFTVMNRDKQQVEKVKRLHKWTNHSGVGYDTFSNISILKSKGAYSKETDSITFCIEFLVRRLSDTAEDASAAV